MSKSKSMLQQLRHLAAWMVAVKVSGFCKISFIVGSCALFFSAHSVVVPLVGAFSGTATAGAVLGMRLIWALLFGSFSLSFLAFCIPGFFASLYWTSPSLYIRCLVPLICMILFIAHPVGAAAWLYTLYWLIPVALYFASLDSVFANAVGSTFVAHAVGSVIWQYTVPMTSAAWLLLIPIVAIERLVFASSMTMLYYGIRFMLSHRALYKGYYAKLVAMLRWQHA